MEISQKNTTTITKTTIKLEKGCKTKSISTTKATKNSNIITKTKTPILIRGVTTAATATTTETTIT